MNVELQVRVVMTTLDGECHASPWQPATFFVAGQLELILQANRLRNPGAKVELEWYGENVRVCQSCLDLVPVERVAMIDEPMCEGWIARDFDGISAPVYRHVDLCPRCWRQIEGFNWNATNGECWPPIVPLRAGEIILYEDILDAEYLF